MQGLTTLAGVGYFFVWTLFGMAVYPLGVALAAVEMHQPVLARAAPIAAGVVVLIAGAIQFTSLEGTSPWLLPGGAGTWLYSTGGRRCRLATRPGARPPLHLLLRQLHNRVAYHRCHGFARDGSRDSSHHRRTPGAGR